MPKPRLRARDIRLPQSAERSAADVEAMLRDQEANGFHLGDIPPLRPGATIVLPENDHDFSWILDLPPAVRSALAKRERAYLRKTGVLI